MKITGKLADSPRDERRMGALYYRLDAADRIVEIGGCWNDFALANAGESVLAECVLGSNVYDHVSGDASRMFLHTLLTATRSLARDTTRPYRCDSPGIKRFMEMSLLPLAEHGVMVAHRMIKVETLPGHYEFIASKKLPHLPNRIVRCSICNRIKHAGEWLETDRAGALGLLSCSGPTPVIYGVCDACMASVRVDER